VNTYILVVYLVVGAIIIFTALVLFDIARTRGRIAQALSMSLFKVTPPAGSLTSDIQSEKDFMSLMERLYATFTNLHAWGWNKFAYGEPYMSLELVVPQVGEEVNFLVSVPQSYGHYFEKQVKSLFPALQIEKIKDLNVFHPKGDVVGASLQLQKESIFPLQTYAKLPYDPLTKFIAVFSNLEREGEGAAIQILIRPSHKERVRKKAEQLARRLQYGSDNHSTLVKPAQNNSPALEALVAKASRPLFDTNIRIIVSSDDGARSQQLMRLITGVFMQFSNPNLNAFKIMPIQSKSLEKFIFSFAYRLFDSKQVIYLSNEELSSLYHFPLPTQVAV